MKVCVFLADGFEEIEGLTVVDILRRAGVSVTMMSVTGNRMIKGSHGITVEADALFDGADAAKADMLVLPGGMPGTKNLQAHRGLLGAMEKAARQGRRIAAICAAPSILGSMGLLKGRTATCYPGFEDMLEGASYTSQGVITDGNITTCRGLGYAMDLGMEMIRLLQGPQQAERIREAIQYDR